MLSARPSLQTGRPVTKRKGRAIPARDGAANNFLNLPNYFRKSFMQAHRRVIPESMTSSVALEKFRRRVSWPVPSV